MSSPISSTLLLAPRITPLGRILLSPTSKIPPTKLPMRNIPNRNQVSLRVLGIEFDFIVIEHIEQMKHDTINYIRYQSRQGGLRVFLRKSSPPSTTHNISATHHVVHFLDREVSNLTNNSRAQILVLKFHDSSLPSYLYHGILLGPEMPMPSSPCLMTRTVASRRSCLIIPSPWPAFIMAAASILKTSSRFNAGPFAR